MCINHRRDSMRRASHSPSRFGQTLRQCIDFQPAASLPASGDIWKEKAKQSLQEKSSTLPQAQYIPFHDFMIHPPLRCEQPDPTRGSSNFAHLAHPTHLPLKLHLVFRRVVWAPYARHSRVNGRVRSSADIKLGELIEFNVDLILRAALCLRFDFLGLSSKTCQWSRVQRHEVVDVEDTYLLNQSGRSSIGDHSIGKTEGRRKILAVEGQLHGRHQS